MHAYSGPELHRDVLQSACTRVDKELACGRGPAIPIPTAIAGCNQALFMANQPRAAAAAGDWHQTIARTTAALTVMDQLAQPEAATALLLHKAEALQALGDLPAAVQALDELLALEASHPAALSLRATLHATAGRRQSTLFDLLQLQKVAPGWKDLLGRLQEAAVQCAGQHRAAPVVRPVRCYARVRRGVPAGASPGVGREGGVAGGMEGVASAYRVLGLPLGAPYADVRAAYKQLAARWHPDKQGVAGEEGRECCGDRFISMQAAYQQLKEHLQQPA